jgi:hypothetical protein
VRPTIALLWLLVLVGAWWFYPRFRRRFLIWRAVLKLRRIARRVKDPKARRELTDALDAFQASDWDEEID